MQLPLEKLRPPLTGVPSGQSAKSYRLTVLPCLSVGRVSGPALDIGAHRDAVIMQSDS